MLVFSAESKYAKAPSLDYFNPSKIATTNWLKERNESKKNVIIEAIIQTN